MSLMWVIYFAGVAGGISSFMKFVGFMFFILAVFGIVFSFISFADKWDDAKIIFKVTVLVVILAPVFALSGILIPDKTTIYLMAGTKVAEDIVKSPEVKEINGKILTIINQKLDSVIEPTSKEK